jgi:N-acylneuraminate cytidylyltransferase
MDGMVEKKLEVLAIIPARGGSKGIPRKNIRDFAGYPLIAYSIQAALSSKYVTRTVVSTDDEEIAEVARRFGAETPFLRPSEFAQDRSLDLPVYQHALKTLRDQEGYSPDLVVQLRPTSPIRPLNLVDEAIETILKHPDADSVRGVVPSGQNPHKMWKVNPKSGLLEGLIKVPGLEEPYNAPRQALPETFWQTGHIDVIKPVVILEQGSMSGKNILPVFIDPDFTVDLDKPSDWIKAEWIVWYAGLTMVTPGNYRRSLPATVELIVFDFDGVMTDNRVFVNQDGIESVAANRGDGMGITLLREAGIPTLVLSKEVNPVVQARCKKLKMPFIQGIDDKPAVLKKYLAENGINPSHVIFVGNDINDVPCFPVVGCAVVVADSHVSALRQADIILQNKGGYGAVREICDLALQSTKNN